ncbi:MAG: phenylpyruvate tautomerase MIF-related protein [Candidatus Fermentibacteria bacterium]
MPLIRLETDIILSREQEINLAAKLSEIVAEKLGKPLEYVMATISTSCFLLSGEPGNAAFVQVMSIGGLNAPVNGSIAAAVSSVLEETLGISAGRVYITFSDISGENWAWQGRTFR